MPELQERDYQERIINKTINYFNENVPSVCITSPTGSGKSVMGLAIAKYLNQQGLSVGWVAMRRNLLRQASKANNEWFNADVKFVSMFDNKPAGTDCIILDECLPYNSEVESIVDGKRTTSKIGDIVENGEATHVLSMDKNGQAEYQPILDRTPMGEKELIEIVIETEEGEEKTLLITEEGRVWVDGEYKKAKDLEIGDTTTCVGECWKTYDKEMLVKGKIKSIKRTGNYVETYDIGVAKNHNFFADGILVHNCQHAATESFNHVSNHDMKFMIGLSATPIRTDKLKLPFNKTIQDSGIHRLIQEGWLSPYEHWCMEEYTPKTVAESYIKDQDRWGKSLVFFHQISQCKEFQGYLAQEGIKCEVVHGASPLSVREDQLDRFDQNEYKVIANVAILTEGFDAPDLNTVFIRDSAKLPTIQMGGRGFRIHPGKTHCNIVQSKNTKWQFVKTAKPQRCWVQKGGDWLALGSNTKVNQVVRDMVERLANAEIEMPRFIMKNRKKRRIFGK